MSNYSFSTTINQPIEVAIEKLISCLHQQKLGIVSDVNVQAILKNKLDEEISAYRILGACNPVLAQKMIAEIPEAGTLLPCTIVVREFDSTTTVIDFMDPSRVLGLADNALMDSIAEDATQRLQAVVAELQQ